MNQKISGIAAGLVILIVSPLFAQKDQCPEGKEQACKEQEKPLLFSGYVQPRWEMTLDTGYAENSFRIRRAYLGASGGFCNWLSYKLLFTLPGASIELYDAYIDITPFKFFGIRVGQFGIPIGMEKLASSSSILFPERTYASGAVKFPLMDRDIGLMLSGKLAFLSLFTGVFNGSGRNKLDDNSNKDIVARVSIDPWAFLHLAGSYQVGNLGPDTSMLSYDRYGVELAFLPSNLWLAAEYMGGREDTVPMMTYYAEAGWLFKLGSPFFYGIQPSVRFEAVDPNTGAPGDAENIVTGGINLHFLPEHKCKLALCYRMINEETNQVANDQVIAQLQVKF